LDTVYSLTELEHFQKENVCRHTGCTFVSPGPTLIPYNPCGDVFSLMDSADALIYGPVFVPSWGNPIGLMQCRICCKLFCDTHLKNGICTLCREVCGETNADRIARDIQMEIWEKKYNPKRRHSRLYVRLMGTIFG
jgi:hypothetical protein